MYTEDIETEEQEFGQPPRHPSQRSNLKNSVRSNAGPRAGYPQISKRMPKNRIANSYREPTDMETDEWDGKTKPMNKLRGQGGPYPQQSMIHAFGESNEFLSYNIEEQIWEMNKYDNNSNYTGNLKYMSAASSPDGKIYLTGGCLITTGDPVNV